MLTLFAKARHTKCAHFAGWLYATKEVCAPAGWPTARGHEHTLVWLTVHTCNTLHDTVLLQCTGTLLHSAHNTSTCYIAAYRKKMCKSHYDSMLVKIAACTHALLEVSICHTQQPSCPTILYCKHREADNAASSEPVRGLVARTVTIQFRYASNLVHCNVQHTKCKGHLKTASMAQVNQRFCARLHLVCVHADC